MKAWKISVLVALGLAACNPMTPTEAPVSAAMSASVPKERLTGNTTKIMVRAFVLDADGKKRNEVKGARCSLKSDELTATVVTPQEVIVPSFKQRRELPKRGVPGSLIVTCKAGEQSGKALVTVNAKSISTATGIGLAGALITIAATTAVATATPWQYAPQASVVMK